MPRWRGWRCAPILPHVVVAKVLLGGEGVVCAAAQGEVVFGGGAAAGVGFEVMEFEASRFSAVDAALIDIRAACGVALPDRASEGCGQVTSGGGRFWCARMSCGRMFATA